MKKIRIHLLVNDRKYYRQAIFLLCILLSLNACYEDKMGCLDIEATNFSVDADIACADCCTFPELKLSILHRLTPNDTFTNFALNTPYQNPADTTQVFLVREVFFYLSDFELERTDGSSFAVTDSVLAKLLLGNLDTTTALLSDNQVFIQRSLPGTRTIGKFKKTGTFAKLRFKMGLSPPATQALPSSLPPQNALAWQADSSNWQSDTGYIFNFINLVRDTSRDTINTVIKISESEIIDFELTSVFQLVRGFNTTIILRINYLDWFQGVDFENDDASVMKEKIVNNIANSIELAAVEQN